MKIFSWMQSKFNAKQETKTLNVLTKNVTATAHHNNKVEESRKDEFSDWPHGLLAIGTFGNNNTTANLEENLNSNIDIDGVIEKELKMILDKAESTSGGEGEEDELDKCVEEMEEKYSKSPLQRIDSMIIEREKDFLFDKNSNGGKNGIIGKKSVSFLLKKMFLCSSGFTPTPKFRDSLPEPRLDKSRMEKILKAILQKKIYPQSTTPKSSANSAKKYLQNNKASISDCESEDEAEQENEGSKWVKTDSEYIVLEI